MIRRWIEACELHGDSKAGQRRSRPYSHQTGMLRGWRDGFERSNVAIVKKIREIKAELMAIKEGHV